MPPKKRRKREFSAEEWKVQRGRRYRKKNANEGKEGLASQNTDWDTKETRGAGYSQVDRDNALFVKYYQGQGFIGADEWETFIAALRTDLPVTFRITGTRNLAMHVLSCLKRKYFVDLEGLEVDGEKLPAPKPLPWYPGNFAWSVPLSKKFIRTSPLVSKFHAFLVRENSQGNISRQEAVSMIPPLLLDVRSTHKVLDMCAAPGSKTAQLIEFLHSEDEGEKEGEGVSPMPSGMVLANDANNKRCYMLVHQAKRLNSPCLMVTNHDASVFPMLYYHDEADVRHPLYYDRVLCDVPCSGDGTLRKNPSIWKSWNPLLGPSLHKLQLRILNRGLELLAVGGRLVYSTCSLNPIENEAVVGTLLSLCKGAVVLVSCEGLLTGLLTMPGRSSWKGMTKEGEWLDNYQSVPEALSRHLKPTMFPQENSNTLGLEKCVRVLPHYQDTGGFFIAVLEKKEWLPWQTKMKAKAAAAQPSVANASLACASDSGMPASNPGIGVSNPDISASNAGIGVSNPDISASNAGISVSSPGIVASDLVKELDGGDAANCRTLVSGAGACDVEDSTVKGRERGEGSATGGTVTASASDGNDTEPLCEEERPSHKILGRPDFQCSSGRGFKEDPFIFFDKDTDFFDTIKHYYGLSEGFPVDQLLTRTRTGKKKNIYFSSKLVKELTVRNEHVLKLINIGVKVMARCAHPQTPCSFRLCQEGVDSLFPYISGHQVKVQQGDLSVLLEEANPLITSLSPCAQDGLQTLGIGPVVFVYVPDITSAVSAASDAVNGGGTDLEVADAESAATDGAESAATGGATMEMDTAELRVLANTESTADCTSVEVDGAADSEKAIPVLLSTPSPNNPPSTLSPDDPPSRCPRSLEIPISCPIYLSGWLAAKSARLFMNKNDRYHFLSMLGHDPPTNQCLDMVNTSRSGRGNEGAGEECGTEDDGQAAGSGRDIEGDEEGCDIEGDEDLDMGVA